MKVIYNKEETQAFRYLMMGDAFMFENTPFIKCDLGEQSSNAVALTTGRKATIGLSCEVLPLHVTCHIGNEEGDPDD